MPFSGETLYEQLHENIYDVKQSETKHAYSDITLNYTKLIKNNYFSDKMYKEISCTIKTH